LGKLPTQETKRETSLPLHLRIDMKHKTKEKVKPNNKSDRRHKGGHQDKENRLMEECLNMEAEKSLSESLAKLKNDI